MPYRLTKIYTRKGDKGSTLLGGQSISKDDELIETLGTIDELNSMIGLVISFSDPNRDKEIKEIAACLYQIQNDLFDLGGELYLPEKVVMSAKKVSELEKKLDTWNNLLPPLKEFILPGGVPPAAACHVARTVCRRAERCMVRLQRKQVLKNPEMLRYLNRLSDLLFVIARVLARKDGKEERMWDHTSLSP